MSPGFSLPLLAITNPPCNAVPLRLLRISSILDDIGSEDNDGDDQNDDDDDDRTAAAAAAGGGGLLPLSVMSCRVTLRPCRLRGV